MSEKYKHSTKTAIERYMLKQLTKDSTKPLRKNQSPERDFLKTVDAWAESKCVFLFRVEAKAVYSEALGRYMYGQTEAGVSDRIGVNSSGTFLAVEAKAPGKRKTVREAQVEFLKKVISNNGFAVVTDSIEHLNCIYDSWLNSPSHLRQTILLNDLPTIKADDNPLFKVDE